MPTAYKDQFYTFDPANPPPVGSAVTFVRWEFIDQNDDGDIDRFNNDSVNGSDVTASWPGDVVTINVPGVGNVTYTGITFYLANGARGFTPTDGQVLQNGTFVGSSFVNGQGPLGVPSGAGPTCFTPGTLIATPGGAVPIEALAEGDTVLTLDNGAEPVRRIVQMRMCGQGACAPVRIMSGALGNTRDLIVSQQHRILVTGWKAELWHGEPEVLVAARHLVNGDTIHLMPCDSVIYIHLILDRHELVWSEGILTESYFGPADAHDEGPEAAMARAMRMDRDAPPRQLCRPALKRHEGALMLA